MLGLVLMLSAGALHPQVLGCAAAVRAQANTVTACADPKVVLFPKDGEEPSPDLSAQCASALLAGRSLGKVPASKAHIMRDDFEKKLAACEGSIATPPAQPKKRDTVKLWD